MKRCRVWQLSTCTSKTSSLCKYCFFLLSILKLPVRCRTGNIRCNEEKRRKTRWRLKSVLWLKKVAKSHHLQVSTQQDWDKGKVPVRENLVSLIITWQVTSSCDTLCSSHMLLYVVHTGMGEFPQFSHRPKNRETLWTWAWWEEWKNSSLPFSQQSKRLKKLHRFHNSSGRINIGQWEVKLPWCYWCIHIKKLLHLKIIQTKKKYILSLGIFIWEKNRWRLSTCNICMFYDRFNL